MQKLDSDKIYNALNVIRTTNGLNKKKDILSLYKDTNLPKILHLIYSPFIHFNISCPQGHIGCGYGTEQFDATTNALLNKLSTGALSGKKANIALYNEMKRLSYASGAVLSWIINKNARLGIAAKSINDVLPNCIPVHDVQLAKPLEEKKLHFPCIISPKLDGLRASFEALEGFFRSRLGNRFYGLNKLEEQAKRICKELQVTKLDGELMVIGEKFNEINGQLRSFNETDNAIFHVFDFPDSSKDQYAKIVLLDRVLWYHNEIAGYENITGVAHGVVNTQEEMYAITVQYMDAGYEGSIIKAMHEPYKNGRSTNWMKIKATETLDLPVVNVFPGTGKYSACAGGITVDFNGVKVRVGSGLSDKQRSYWWQDPDLIIGKTVEVAFQEITADKSLRHPRLKCVRGDK